MLYIFTYCNYTKQQWLHCCTIPHYKYIFDIDSNMGIPLTDNKEDITPSRFSTVLICQTCLRNIVILGKVPADVCEQSPDIPSILIILCSLCVSEIPILPAYIDFNLYPERLEPTDIHKEPYKERIAEIGNVLKADMADVQITDPELFKVSSVLGDAISKYEMKTISNNKLCEPNLDFITYKERVHYGYF